MATIFAPSIRLSVLSALTLALLPLITGCSEDAAQAPPTWAVDFDTERTDTTVLHIVGLDSPSEEAFLALDHLRSLPQHSFESIDPWYDRDAEFHGVSLYTLLHNLGIPADTASVVLHASNDYEIEVDLSDVRRYEYLLALGEDGKPYNELPRERNKGNSAIAIDFDTFDELELEIYKYHLAWWIDKIELRRPTQ